ncbi:hypothetical protein [Scytonema millei]|uniref:Uncharacterized protein n=1 Tax=Scytonema millei VB511283 TaxID=1245923 RepID=A0A9X5I762_9CYAN|nr:hypothetical protein [Scytonema millei]NHC38323.1 hypothetical protein [Scytonema millei VB511283]
MREKKRAEEAEAQRRINDSRTTTRLQSGGNLRFRPLHHAPLTTPHTPHPTPHTLSSLITDN